VLAKHNVIGRKMKLFTRLLLVICLSLPLLGANISVTNGFNSDWLNGRSLWIVSEDDNSSEVLKATFTSDHVLVEGIPGGYNQPYTIVNGIIKIDEEGVEDGNTTYPAGSYQYMKILKIVGTKIIVSDSMDYDETINQVYGDGKDIDLLFLWESDAKVYAEATSAYGYDWIDRKYLDERYSRTGNTVDFNSSTKVFRLTATFAENNDSRAAIKTYMDKNYATSISTNVKPIQLNPYSRVQLLTSTPKNNGYFINTGINVQSNDVYYWLEIDDGDGNYTSIIDSGVDSGITSFPSGATGKNLDLNITIQDNTLVYTVKDINTSTTYSKIFDFSTDLNSSAASSYLAQTGETLSIKEKAFESIRLRSRTEHSYGGDVNDGNSTIAEVHDVKTHSTSIDAYGFTWKDMKYRRGDARYLGDDNTVDFNSSTQTFTLKAGFKQTDTNALDFVDERDSRSSIRVKDYQHTTKQINATLKPIQANPYSRYQITGSIWEEINDTGLYTSLSLAKNGASIFLGFVNDNNYTSLLPNENKITGEVIATFGQDVTGKQWNLDISIGSNSIVYTVKNLDDNSTTVKVIDFDTDLNSTAVAQYQTDIGEALSIDDKAFNITTVRDKTDFTDGGDAGLGVTTVMEVYGFRSDKKVILHDGIEYGTVTSPFTGKVWLDRNLGASEVCTSLDDAACYGDYYQWGRAADGHQESNSTTTSTLATTTTPGHGDFITISVEPYDWTTADSNGSLRSEEWSKTDGTSICPLGYRVPTKDEIAAETVDASIPVSNNVDAFNSFLKLPSAGKGNPIDGSINFQSTHGFLWSSSSVSSYSGNLAIFNSSVFTSNENRATASSVRCIKDSTDISISEGFNEQWLEGRTLYTYEVDNNTSLIETHFENGKQTATVDLSYDQNYTVISGGIIQVDETNRPNNAYQYYKIVSLEDTPNGQKIGTCEGENLTTVENCSTVTQWFFTDRVDGQLTLDGGFSDGDVMYEFEKDDNQLLAWKVTLDNPKIVDAEYILDANSSFTLLPQSSVDYKLLDGVWVSDINSSYTLHNGTILKDNNATMHWIEKTIDLNNPIQEDLPSIVEINTQIPGDTNVSFSVGAEAYVIGEYSIKEYFGADWIVTLESNGTTYNSIESFMNSGVSFTCRYNTQTQNSECISFERNDPSYTKAVDINGNDINSLSDGMTGRLVTDGNNSSYAGTWEAITLPGTVSLAVIAHIDNQADILLSLKDGKVYTGDYRAAGAYSNSVHVNQQALDDVENYLSSKTFSGQLVNNDKNITTIELEAQSTGVVTSATVDGNGNFNIAFSTDENYKIKLIADDGTVWYYNKYSGAIQQYDENRYIDLAVYTSDLKILATEVRTIDAYGHTWEDRHYRDERYSRVGNRVDFNTTENAFTLQSIFVEGEESRTEIREHDDLRSVVTHIKPIQMNPYSKVDLLTGVYQSSNDDFGTHIGVRNNDIYYWVDFGDGNGNYIDIADHSEVNTSIVSFPQGVTNKNLELSTAIVDNSFVMKVKDLDTNTTYTRTFDFSTTDVDSTAAAMYQSQTGKVLSVEDKAFNGVELRSRNNHTWGGDPADGNTTIVKILDVKTDSTSIDAYGFTWENMKYSRSDARYIGVNNSVDFNASTNIATLQAAFKQTDTNTQDSVDERDSRATMRVKDYNNPIKSLSATIKPIQANPYSWYQIAGTAWDEVNDRGVYTSLGLTKNGASIFLGFFNGHNYTSLLPNENEITGKVIANFAQDVTGKQWNLDISIVNNSIVYTVENLEDHNITKKVINFDTDLNSTAVSQYQTQNGEALSIQSQSFNIERVRTKTDFLYGGDPNLGSTTVMEVYDVYMGDVQDTADNDSDGIPDIIDPDDDNDGISDVDEIKWGLDPLDASDGGNTDTDGDGVSNKDEIKAGSDPHDPNDTKRPKKFIPIMMDGLIIIVPIH